MLQRSCLICARRTVKTAFVLTTVMLLLICLVPEALAGSGRILIGTPYLLDLNVGYTYDEIAPWFYMFRDAFQEASGLLYAATDGQMQFGTVRVSNNPTFLDYADFWILPGAGRAFSTDYGGLGVPGVHMTIYKDRHRFTAEDGPNGDERGQFGIVHELGHYVFDLADEYFGPNNPSTCCTSCGSTVACIMEGGTEAHPSHHRTEFCTNPSLGLSTAHVTSPVTQQQYEHGCACWDTIASFCSSRYGITMNKPTAEAGHTNPAVPAGHRDINWVEIQDILRNVICIDKSGSMAGEKMERTKQAASLFVDLVHEDENEALGVTSFSTTADVDFPMEEVTSSHFTKDRARNAIDAISVEDMTNITGGLRISGRQLPPAGLNTIILLSDGQHNVGEGPDSVIPELRFGMEDWTGVRGTGVRVFTIGLKDPSRPWDLDEDTLQHIADQTGGKYRLITTDDFFGVFELWDCFVDYSAEIRGDSVISEEMGSVEAGGTKEQGTFVDPFTGEATFIIHWPAHFPEGKGIFDLELLKPDGTTIVDPSAAATDPDVKYLETDYYAFYRIKNPDSGNWKLRIKAANSTYLEKLGINTPSVSYNSQVLASARAVDFTVFTDKPVYTPPNIPVIRASVAAGTPVAKALVTGIVTGPNGTQFNIKLYDDGNLASHGDEVPDDGIYSNRFLDSYCNGTYTFALAVNNVEGVEATPDEPPIPPEWKPEIISPFTRVSKCTILIRLPELPDLNGDGNINIIDISTAAKAFNTRPGQPLWNPIADTDGNGIVNILDISKVAKYFGRKVTQPQSLSDASGGLSSSRFHLATAAPATPIEDLFISPNNPSTAQCWIVAVIVVSSAYPAMKRRRLPTRKRV